MEKRINMGGEFYMADFGYFSMSVYIAEGSYKSGREAVPAVE
ncbi:MAG: hypothetical protein ACYCPR_09065 [Thermoplasmataceae archaeon]